MAKERAKKKSFQESLEDIKEKMKEKRNKRLASVSAPNRGRTRTQNKCSGSSNTSTILKGVQQNNKALAVALQTEKEKVRQAHVVILQLKREQQALFLHLLLLKKKLKEQEALSANSSQNKSTNNTVQPQSLQTQPTDSQRKNKNTVETPPQRGSPLCTDRPSKEQERDKPLPPTVGVRRRHADRSSSRRRSERVQELRTTTEDTASSLDTLTASPICSDDTNHTHTHQEEEPVIADPIEEYQQHSTPEPAPAKSQQQGGRRAQTRTKPEPAPKKPERGRKAERGPLKKPWENPKLRARSKSRDRSSTHSKTAPPTQNNKLNTSLGFNDTFDFDCEEAVHVTPFKAKPEDSEISGKDTQPKEQAEPSPAVSKDSLSQTSSESEDSLYVPYKSKKKHPSPEKPQIITKRRGRAPKKSTRNDENVPPQQEFTVYRDEESTPKVERSKKKDIPELKSVQPVCSEQEGADPETGSVEGDMKELPLVSPLVEAEMMRIDNVLSHFGDSSHDNSPHTSDQTPRRAKTCKKRVLGMRPAGRGLSLCDVTNLSPAVFRKFPCGSRLSDTPASSTPGPARKRRCTMTVDYKEPSLNAKLRRGDKFTDLQFLRSPVFKQKSGRRSVQKLRTSMKMQTSFEKYNESFVGCR